MMKKDSTANNWQYAMLALGVSACLTGTFFMIVGGSVLGESHTGIASVIGITGLCLIAGSKNRGRRPS